MARHLDLGNDRDETVGRIAHDFPRLVLRIESAVRHRVVRRGRVQIATVAERAYARQLRIFLDLDPPALILRQVPVEAIDLVHGQNVDELLDVVHREKVPAHVEHTSAVSEIRLIGDFDDRQLDNAGFLAPEHGLGQQLAYRLERIIDAGGTAPDDPDALGTDADLIGFGRQIAQLDADRVGIGASSRFDFQRAAERRLQQSVEEIGAAQQHRVVGQQAYLRRPGQIERPVGGFNRYGTGHDIDRFDPRNTRAAGAERQQTGTADRPKQGFHRLMFWFHNR